MTHPPGPGAPEPAPHLQMSRRQMRRVSCAYYAQDMLRGPLEAPYNGRFITGSHHEVWDRLIHESNRLCIIASRDIGKTFFWSYAYPLWKADHQPGGQGYIFSNAQEQAVKILDRIKAEVESNPRLAHLLPTGPGKVWSATVAEFANGHRIYAKGFGSRTRGAHPNWATCDDILNDEDAWSETVRRKRIDYYLTAISGMMHPTAQLVAIGTPFHHADLLAFLSKNKQYRTARFPAIDPTWTKPLWPERYDIARLLAKRDEITSLKFTREYLVQPVSDETSLFPAQLFQGAPIEVFSVRLGMPAKFWNAAGITRRYIGVDLAISASTGADFTVLFVVGVDAVGNRWVIDIIRQKGLGFQQQLSLINAAGRKYDPDLIFIEANQMQRVFGDELIRTSDLPIRKFVTTGRGKSRKLPGGDTTTANKNSLEGGVPALRVLLENRKFRIPRGDARSVEITDQWISEMTHFTWSDGKLQGVGEHDDTVMACFIADQAVRQGGFSFSTGEEDDRPVGKDGKRIDQTVDEILKEDSEEPPPPPDLKPGEDPVERLLARFGNAGPTSPADPEDLEGGGMESEEDTGVDSEALSLLFPNRS